MKTFFFPAAKEKHVNTTTDTPSTVIDGTELIVVRMHAPGRTPWRESFTGKWVNGSLRKGGWVDASWGETGMSWHTAITATGRPVAYRALTSDEEQNRKHGFSENMGESLLLVFDTAEEFAEGIVRAGFPAGCVKYELDALNAAVIRHHDW